MKAHNYNTVWQKGSGGGNLPVEITEMLHRSQSKIIPSRWDFQQDQTLNNRQTIYYSNKLKTIGTPDQNSKKESAMRISIGS